MSNFSSLFALKKLWFCLCALRFSAVYNTDEHVDRFDPQTAEQTDTTGDTGLFRIMVKCFVIMVEIAVTCRDPYSAEEIPG